MDGQDQKEKPKFKAKIKEKIGFKSNLEGFNEYSKVSLEELAEEH